ncbi:unnamed protein product [Rotaria sordida]|uniref:Uncharacterized protein n=1 Tax=Rotaria sordida TaxID=392033 RepID=A0A820LNC0_9BILA|nr:unnamed protein product [Rotaria sordida]
MKRYRRQSRINDTISDERILISKEFQQWFDYLVWAEYLKWRDLQISTAEKVFHFDEYRDKQYIQLDNYIDKRLKDLTDRRKT